MITRLLAAARSVPARIRSLPDIARTLVKDARSALRAVFAPRTEARRAKRRTAPSLPVIAGAAALAVLAGVVTAAVVPRPPSEAAVLEAYITEHAQTLTVPATVAVAPIAPRDNYSATPGIDTLAAGGTNYDWAKMVLLFGGWPMTESNVTVITRWMRQENGPDDWWNRNNPLNNGWGSGGGGGTGTYDTLVIAAQNAAEALTQNGGYSGIREALAESADTGALEAAIWASPWATGHYDNGGHWSYAPVPVIKSPDGTW